MRADNKLIEQRKHKRFRAKDWIFALFQSNFRLGQILNIGLGGFSFFYAAAPNEEEYFDKGGLSIDIFDTMDGNRLEKVQCKIIYEFEEDCPRRPEKTRIRRCGAQFICLTHLQLSQLIYVIQNYTDYNPAKDAEW